MNKKELKNLIKEMINETKKTDFMARYNNTDIFIECGYSYMSDDELDSMFYDLGKLVKKYNITPREIKIKF